MENGKHVITANKALIAEHGNEIFAAAEKNSVQVCFEAAVAGGIPIIKTLREGLSANRIEWLAGIINGTGNFILSEMRSAGRDFADVLQEAQDKGYAEADPTFDVEGIDAAHKLAILASIAFGMPLQFDKTYTQGISELDLQDVAYAEELGYRIKHLGIARNTEAGVELRVHPTLIPASRLIANVDGVMNAVLVKGDAVGATLHYGAGAGGDATASSVIADIVDVARLMGGSQSQHVPSLSVSVESLQQRAIVPIEDVSTAFYLRLTVLDQPGVLSTVTKQFSDAGISIEAVIQKQPMAGEKTVPLILLTDVTSMNKLQPALDGLTSLSVTTAPVVTLRVESLG
ncbi:MAG: homoserine dehydrogenase [Pseudomonadales bacterium]